MPRERARAAHKGQARWPAGWSERRRSEWTGKGGTLELSATLHQCGWPAAEAVKQTADIPDLSGLAAPTGGARLHRMLEDDLASLLADPGLLLEPDAGLTYSRRWPDGRREIWQMKAAADELMVTHYVKSSRPGWQVERHQHDATDLLQAMASDPRLHELTGDTISHIVTGDGAASQATVIQALRVVNPPASAEEWRSDIASEWEDEDEFIQEEFSDLEWCPVWARLNGVRISALQPAGGSPSSVTAVLVDLDEPELVPIAEIATSSWFSESGGGAPISWDGGNRLVQITATLGCSEQWGDLGSERQFFPLPDTDSAMATLISDWVIDNDSQLAAAFALEELDPRGTLNDDHRREWNELIEDVTISLSLDVQPAVEDLIRARLRNDDRYARAARALDEPGGEDGAALRQALAGFAEDGVLGPLINGDW